MYSSATKRKLAKINNNNKSKNKVDNNFYSNNNPCADSYNNNDNNKDSNIICASIPTPSNSNADNVSPGRNNKNNVMHLPRFISSHPNRIVLNVFKQSTTDKQSALSVTKKSSDIASLKDLVGKQRSTKTVYRFYQPSKMELYYVFLNKNDQQRYCCHHHCHCHCHH